MKIGQYYQPLPMSMSADALIRCSDKTIVCFQFKNFQRPFPQSSLEEEVIKCGVDEWNVFLVIVCTEGHLINEGKDTFVVRGRVTVVLLSADSVAQFLGATALNKLSSTSLYEDLSLRI